MRVNSITPPKTAKDTPAGQLLGQHCSTSSGTIKTATNPNQVGLSHHLPRTRIAEEEIEARITS